MKINKPVVSENFTIADIHKIREYNYERKKNFTLKEYVDDINKRAEELKKKKVAI